MIVENPFLVYSPEDITPQEFKEIFVREHTWINALETPKDYFIDGVRGSGKSMLLNYLELSHQLCYYDNNLTKFFENVRTHKYIGIMVHATLEELNTELYELLIRNELGEEKFIKDLCMTDLVMAILYKVLNTLLDTKEMTEHINAIEGHQAKEFCRKEFNNLDERKIHKLDFDQERTNTDMFALLADMFLDGRKRIKYFLHDRLQMKDIVYEGNILSFSHIHSLIRNIKKILNIEDFSFYILIDNGDETKSTMQLCIDDLIRQRGHRDVCFKVAVKKGTYWNRGNIQSPHDFSKIDIDEIYSTEYTVYSKRIREIATKRLELKGINIPVEEFFPESLQEKKLLQKIENKLKVEYEKEYDEKYGNITDDNGPSKSEYVSNLINKNAQSELFRSQTKTPKSYAGFSNIVHLSSGIIRQFLDICSYIFEEEIKKTKGKEIVKINLKTQNEVIKRYADDFMDEIEMKCRTLEEEEHVEEARLYRGLYTLIEALGSYYKERLMDPNSNEPRVFTFTLKDSHRDPEIEKILEIGVNGRGLTGNYFQTYWYSSKTGIGKYRAYAFNRRLCPRYRIDHTSFRGRIELSTADLRSAIENGKIPKSRSYVEREKFVPLDEFFEVSK